MAHHTIQTSGKNCRVTLNGDLTASTVPELQTAFRQELERGISELTIDLGQTVALDSSGIGLLIAAHNSLKSRHGTLRVVNVSKDILQLLQSLRLTQRFNVSSASSQ
jgi:anti-anti-sigma factor